MNTIAYDASQDEQSRTEQNRQAVSHDAGCIAPRRSCRSRPGCPVRVPRPAGWMTTSFLLDVLMGMATPFGSANSLHASTSRLRPSPTEPQSASVPRPFQMLGRNKADHNPTTRES